MLIVVGITTTRSGSLALRDEALSLGLECVVDVRDEEELESALERLDPEIFLLSPREAEDDEEASTGCSSCCPTCRPGSSRSPSCTRPAASRWSRSSARASTPSSSARATWPSSSVARRRRSEPTRAQTGAEWLALAAILVLAAALRLVGIQYGLPFPLLDPDEQTIVPRAWRMVHGGGLDPHWFDYPSALLYVLAPFQAWQHAPSFLAARLVMVAFGLGAVAGPGGSAGSPTDGGRGWSPRRPSRS